MNSASEDSGTPVRRSPRKTTKGNDVAGRVTSPSSKSATPPKATKKKAVKRKLVKRIVSKSTNDDASSASSSLHNESPSTQNATKKSPKRKVKKTVSRSSENDAVDSVVASKKRAAPKKAEVSSNVKAKKAKAVPHQQITQRDVLPKLWDAKEAREKYGSYTFKIMSWNVAGLRGLLKKHPNALPDLAEKHDIDLLCLQETKLQEIHLSDPKMGIKGLLDEVGYDSHYSCSSGKKGYSGTAVYIKRRALDSIGSNHDVEKNQKSHKKKKQATIGSFFSGKKDTVSEKDNTASIGADASALGDVNVADLIPVNVSFSIAGDKDHDKEGRSICVDFPHFTILNCYVPNAGAKLERLDYRTEKWDRDLLKFMQEKEKARGVPSIWLGDLNVAHKAYDVWNDGAKHLPKQAGVTKQERESFQRQLDADGGSFVDAFRHLFPDAKGHYSFWSQRAGNRPPNKGLRLDYFICSKELFLDDKKEAKILVRDSYMLHEQEGSDHCPVVLELEIRK